MRLFAAAAAVLRVSLRVFISLTLYFVEPLKPVKYLNFKYGLFMGT